MDASSGGEPTVNWKVLAASTRVEPNSDVDLAGDFDPGRHDVDLAGEGRQAALNHAIAALFDLQDKFAAQADRSLLVVLQAMDAAGKDGTIKHVMTGLNPASVEVHSFKTPSPAERAHGYLWRHQQVVPELGRIAIFNRSHYENVLVTRVHPQFLWPETPPEHRAGLWKRRYREINEWERYLSDNGTVLVKLFLNLSKDEQERRFLERIDRPEKNWKFSPADLRERSFWDEYQLAFADMLTHTSTEWAPWHVIPADHKWFSHLSVSAVLLETLRHLDPQYPIVDDATKQALQKAKEELLGKPASPPAEGPTP
jgi:PPK2 family polyphosphate:nucleotide phosphotransferase